LAGEDSILLKISLKLLQDILEGPFDTVGSLQRAYKFQQLAQETLFMVNGWSTRAREDTLWMMNIFEPRTGALSLSFWPGTRCASLRPTQLNVLARTPSCSPAGRF